MYVGRGRSKGRDASGDKGEEMTRFKTHAYKAALIKKARQPP